MFITCKVIIWEQKCKDSFNLISSSKEVGEKQQQQNLHRGPTYHKDENRYLPLENLSPSVLWNFVNGNIIIHNVYTPERYF